MRITEEEFGSLTRRLTEYKNDLLEIYDIERNRKTILGNIGEKVMG
jgi:hypothetical protein